MIQAVERSAQILSCSFYVDFVETSSNEHAIRNSNTELVNQLTQCLMNPCLMQDWIERVQQTGQGLVDKHFIFFTDRAGLTWKGKPIESTLSETLETYCGPAIMIFHIPFTIGKDIRVCVHVCVCVCLCVCLCV